MRIKIFKSGIIPFLLGVFMMMAVASCKKDAYRTDGGLASENTTLSTYDYLAANANHQFDTLLLIVDHYNLKDSVNKAGTFFAPTDYAIHTLMTLNNIATLDALYRQMTSQFLTQYMFSENTLTLDNATTSVRTYKNWAGITVGVAKIATPYLVVTTTLTYYTLEYVKINGVVDGSTGAPANDETDAILRCQTTGIRTSTGTNLNVLANNAPLNLIGPPTKLRLSYDINVKQSATDYSSTDIQLDAAQIAGFLGLTAEQVADSVVNGSTRLVYYALQPDSTLSNRYTADFPGFWYDPNGYVTDWGNNSYLWADFFPGTFMETVGQYPGNAKVGDKYVLQQVFVYTNADGIRLMVYIRLNVTLV